MKQEMNKKTAVKLEVFTAVRMMMFFWVLGPCKLVCRCQRFGETHNLSEDGDNMFLRNVGIYLRVYTAPKPVRITTLKTAVYGNTEIKCLQRSTQEDI
jgi:hypothetical protein